MTAQASFDLTGSFANVYSEPGDRHLRVGDGEVGLHHRDASETELAAALSVVETSGQQKVDLLKVLVDADWNGSTDWETHFKTGMLMSTICSRRNALVRRGWVKDSGRRRISPMSGLYITVWTSTITGRRQVK